MPIGRPRRRKPIKTADEPAKEPPDDPLTPRREDLLAQGAVIRAEAQGRSRWLASRERYDLPTRPSELTLLALLPMAGIRLDSDP